MDRIDFAKKLIIEVGRSLDVAFHNLKRENAGTKSDTTFVTAEDKDTEDFLVSKLLAEFPDDGFLAEEGTNKPSKSGYRWVIDPIDGTTNFVYRFPLYTISIGLTHEGRLVGGLIYVPSTQKLYSAEASGGFFVNDMAMTVSNVTNPADAMAIFSIAHKAPLRKINTTLYPIVFTNVRKLRILGSISFELTQVATGLADVVVNVDSTEWDDAAGVLMVREAGGAVIDFTGNDWTPASKTLIAGNKQICENMLAIIKKEFPMDLLSEL